MTSIKRDGSWRLRVGLAGAGALCICGLSREAAAQAATTPGAITIPHPTLEHMSIDWAITGDDDADGVVTVRFREQGTTEWRDGLPLSRVPAGDNEGFSWANRHAGSIFGLVPATAYEIELSLTDPDGGDDQQLVTAQTRPIPEVPADARVVNVTPATIDAALSSAEPGDLLLLDSGTYSDIIVDNDGTPERPLVVRGGPNGDAVVEGEVRMDGRSDVWIEGLTVRGQIKFNGATRVVVRGCRVEAATATGDGIVSYGDGSTDGYFADNVVIGTTVWAETSLGVDGDNLGEGIVMTGPGNVIAHNRVSGFRDCISLLEDSGVVQQHSIDILRNELDTCADDAIEADFSQGNVRVVANRILNSFVGLSSQPSLGGPTYFVRNVMFNAIFNPFKLNRGSVGDVALHNTVVKCGDALGVYAGVTWSRALFRNNLFLGGVGGDTFNGFSNGSGRVLHVPDAEEATCSFDYDGFGSIGTGSFEGRVGNTTFSSLAELQSLTTEQHAVEVDLSVFGATVEFPEVPFPAKAAPDLRPAAGSPAVDQGTVLPTVNDDYAGSAPDLGAYELGAVVPEYGPRGDATGGAGGASGAGGSAGAAGAGGETPASGGAPADGGSSASGAGGSTGAAGAAGASQSSGGAPADGGSSASGASGTSGGDGGTAQGGSSAGATPSGGSSGARSSDGGSQASGTAGLNADGGESGDDDGGCGCRTVRSPDKARGALALAALLVLGRWRRRAERRRA